MRDPQRHIDAGALDLLPRHAQKMARREFVLEDDEDCGAGAVAFVAESGMNGGNIS